MSRLILCSFLPVYPLWWLWRLCQLASVIKENSLFRNSLTKPTKDEDRVVHILLAEQFILAWTNRRSSPSLRYRHHHVYQSVLATSHYVINHALTWTHEKWWQAFFCFVLFFAVTHLCTSLYHHSWPKQINRTPELLPSWDSEPLKSLFDIFKPQGTHSEKRFLS